MTVSRNLKIGISGVRGIVGETLTPLLAADFAAAFGEFIGRGRVIVGRDTRPSGAMLEHAVTAGLSASGCAVVSAGIVPTPTIQIAVRQYNADGGIAITASHNPNEWNALKFIDQSACFLTQDGMDALLDVYNQPADGFVCETEFRNVRKVSGLFEKHAEMILSQVDTDAIRRAELTVAADCCGGVGAFYTPAFLERLGCKKVIPVFDNRDGIFGRPPEPVAKNLDELCRTVRENHCDLGFAQDPDGDRISVVSDRGIPLGEQYSILIPAIRIFERVRGCAVVNIQTTKALADLAEQYGCRVVYSKVGEGNVTESMREQQAVFGAEGGSGGVIWPLIHHCRDSFGAMALTLEAVALRKCSVSRIIEGFPHYYSCTEKITAPAQSVENALRKIAVVYAIHHPILIDGVRLELGDSWVLMRPSNTEPVVRIYAESRVSQDDANRLAARFAAEIRMAL